MSNVNKRIDLHCNDYHMLVNVPARRDRTDATVIVENVSRKKPDRKIASCAEKSAFGILASKKIGFLTLMENRFGSHYGHVSYQDPTNQDPSSLNSAHQ